MGQANILLIHSDQHRYDCVGVNGHPWIQTPNLDRLAREGVNFSHAFCPIPLCVPARASLLTSLWPTQHASIANEGTEAFRPLRHHLPTFSELLHKSGYYLGYIGKWHVDQYRSPLEFGFDDYIREGSYGDWRQGQGLSPKPCNNRWFGEVDPHIKSEQSRLAWGADNTIRMLETHADKGKPFFVRWDPSEPHLPNIVPEPYASLYPPEKIKPWLSFPDELNNKPYIQRQQRRTWDLEDWTWQDWAPLVSRYLGEISLLDVQVGRLLDTLERLGISEDTLVIYTTDHGDMCGAHGMIDKHFIMYDDVVRVPLLMRWPGRIPAGKECDAFVSSALDLACTFCEAAGIPQPDTFMGESLLPLVCGTAKSRREDIFATYHGNQFGLYSQRMVRDRHWKYIWNATAEDEFYDLQNDPGELVNLATNPAYTTELSRLRKRLVHWMENTHDGLLNSWIRRQIEEGLTL